MTAEPVPLPHVFIVEDDPLVTDAIRILLESSGFRVTTAHTVRDAHARLVEETPALLQLRLLQLLNESSGHTVILGAPNAGTDAAMIQRSRPGSGATADPDP